MFKKKSLLLQLALIGFLMSSCASIVSKSKYDVAFNSKPEGVPFVVKNKAGETVHSGVTPETVVLKSSAGFFKGETYSVEFTRGGTTKTVELDSKISGWYWGNFLFGGLLGMLIVDPATGAMFNLPKSVSVDFEDNSVTGVGKNKLNILSINDVPSSMKDQLIKIN